MEYKLTDKDRAILEMSETVGWDYVEEELKNRLESRKATLCKHHFEDLSEVNRLQAEITTTEAVLGMITSRREKAKKLRESAK